MLHFWNLLPNLSTFTEMSNEEVLSTKAERRLSSPRQGYSLDRSQGQEPVTSCVPLKSLVALLGSLFFPVQGLSSKDAGNKGSLCTGLPLVFIRRILCPGLSSHKQVWATHFGKEETLCS